MANKKGEGVRGVLGDLVSKERDRPEHPRPSAEIAGPQPARQEPPEPERHAHSEGDAETVEASHGGKEPPRKATGIKGRPRGRKDESPNAKAERTKVTLSIDEVLRDQFYRLAHGEMIQPGEYVERALRYYIKNHPQ